MALPTLKPLLPKIVIEKTNGGNYTILNGSNQNFSAASNSVHNFTTGSFSISAWIRLKSELSDVAIVAAKKVNTTTGDGYRFGANGSKRLFINFGDGSASATSADDGTVMSVDIWYLATWVIDRTNNLAVRYLNAVVDGTVLNISGVSGSITNTQTFNVGKNSHANSNYFPGDIADLRVWNVALTQDQVKELYNTHDISGLTAVSQYLFKGNGNDSIGSNNLTATNSPTYGTDGPTKEYIYNPHEGIFNFRISGATIKPAFDSNGGRFEVTIYSEDGSNGQANTILKNIGEGFEILFSVGKTSSVTDVLRGTIEEIAIHEMSNSTMEIKLSGFDWGTDLLNSRIVSLYKQQKRQANGRDVDPTDTSTSLFNIVKILLGAATLEDGSVDYSAYIGDPNNPSSIFSVKDQGMIVNDANIKDMGTSVPVFQVSTQRLQDVLSQIDALDSTIHYVRPDKTFVRQPNLDSGGFSTTGILLTDNNEDPELAEWEPTKFGLILPNTTYIKSVVHQRRRLLGVNQTQSHPDQKQETDNAGINNYDGGHGLTGAYLAVKFTPTQRRLADIGIKVSSTGFVPDELSPTLKIEVREDNNNTPNGSRIGNPVERLPGSIPGTADWVYFGMNNVELNTAKSYWIVVYPSPETSKYYTWRHDNGSSGTNAYSTDGSNWTVQDNSFEFCFRQDTSDDLITIYPLFGVTASTRHMWEEVIRRDTLSKGDTLNNNYNMVKYLTTQAITYFKRKETIQCEVVSPDVLLTPGQLVRIRKQASGYAIDDNYVVTSVQYIFDPASGIGTGTLYLEISATKFSTYEY